MSVLNKLRKKFNSKKKRIIIIAIAIVIILLTFLFWPTSEYTTFKFIHELTNETISGTLFFDNESYKYVEDGVIKIPYLENLPNEMIFKGEYNGTDFEVIYDFPEDYWDYYEYNFLVSISDNEAQFYFYDNKTNCTLDGEIYFGDNLVGKSQDGIFLLSKKDYDKFWIGEVKIEGLTNYCFGINKDLPFVRYWTAPDIEYYFENDEYLEFITQLNPRSPIYAEEAQGFIRPYEVEEKISKITFNVNASDLEDLYKIFAYTYMNYVSDNGKFGETDYWQTPKDFMNNKGGDCEDWAIYAVSLIRAHNSNLSCYAARWLTHMNILCVIENKFILLDQDKVEKTFTFDNKLSLQDNEVHARSWRNNYFEEYGITPDERVLYYLFNEKEIIEFENGQEDFINWTVNRGLEYYNESIA